MSRPVTVMTEETKDEIIERMIGGETIARICVDEHMPSRSYVYLYLSKKGEEHLEFRQRYIEAYEMRRWHLADEIIDIADDTSGDWEKRKNERGEEYEVVNHDAITARTLRVKARMWMLERLVPNTWGKNTKEVVNAPNSGQGFQVNIINYGPLPDEKLIPKTIPSRITEAPQRRPVEDASADPEDI